MGPRRSTPASWTDRRRFRIKVKFGIPPNGLGRVTDDLHLFLSERLGHGCYAVHPDDWSLYMQASAIHFDDHAAVSDVVAWLEARVPAVAPLDEKHVSGSG
jgi:hypothetical protein